MYICASGLNEECNSHFLDEELAIASILAFSSPFITWMERKYFPLSSPSIMTVIFFFTPIAS
jgi:hypothetical protein